MYCPGMSPWVMGIGFLGFIVALLVLVWAVPQIARAASAHSREKPLEILQRRYAEGKLTKEEYDERKKDLEG